MHATNRRISARIDAAMSARLGRMPPTPLSFPCTSDPAEAKAWFGDLIEREPVALSVIGSVADGLIGDPTRYENPRWWAAKEGDTVVAAYMHTPPHPLHVGLSTPERAQGLAEQLAAEGDVLPGVGGIRDAAVRFADTWCRLTGAGQEVAMETASYELPERPRLPFEVEGSYRLATQDDLELVDAWMRDFRQAVDPHTAVSNPSLGPQVAAGRVGLWTVDGAPVSMACASWANAGVTRVSGVWTPPDLRGNGYASAVVAALSDQRMDAGEGCMLYTDLANPTSNGIYQALGYRRIGDSISIRFT